MLYGLFYEARARFALPNKNLHEFYCVLIDHACTISLDLENKHEDSLECYVRNEWS